MQRSMQHNVYSRNGTAQHQTCGTLRTAQRSARRADSDRHDAHRCSTGPSCCVLRRWIFHGCTTAAHSQGLPSARTRRTYARAHTQSCAAASCTAATQRRLWQGPGTGVSDYYVMAHDESSGNLSVWWDVAETPTGSWSYGPARLQHVVLCCDALIVTPIVPVETPSRP